MSNSVFNKIPYASTPSKIQRKNPSGKYGGETYEILLARHFAKLSIGRQDTFRISITIIAGFKNPKNDPPNIRLYI